MPHGSKTYYQENLEVWRALEEFYQLGLLPLPKSTHKEFMKINSSLDFVISEEDMQLLKSIS